MLFFRKIQDPERLYEIPAEHQAPILYWQALGCWYPLFLDLHVVHSNKKSSNNIRLLLRRSGSQAPVHPPTHPFHSRLPIKFLCPEPIPCQRDSGFHKRRPFPRFHLCLLPIWLPFLSHLPIPFLQHWFPIPPL